jgi:hypothetical protein
MQNLHRQCGDIDSYLFDQFLRGRIAPGIFVRRQQKKHRFPATLPTSRKNSRSLQQRTKLPDTLQVFQIEHPID